MDLVFLFNSFSTLALLQEERHLVFLGVAIYVVERSGVHGSIDGSCLNFVLHFIQDLLLLRNDMVRHHHDVFVVLSTALIWYKLCVHVVECRELYIDSVLFDVDVSLISLNFLFAGMAKTAHPYTSLLSGFVELFFHSLVVSLVQQYVIFLFDFIHKGSMRSLNFDPS